MYYFTMDLTRRGFIRGVGASVGAVGLEGVIEGFLNFASPQKRLITFEEALHRTPELRQQYLTQLLDKVSSTDIPNIKETIGELIYDDNKTKVREHLLVDIEKVLFDKELFETEVNIYLNRPKFTSLRDEEKSRKREHLLTTPEGGKELENYLREWNQEKELEIERSAMFLIHRNTATNIGKRFKSTIYVFGEAFKERYVEFKQLKDFGITEIKFNIKPKEQILISMLKHESVHADDYYNGIILGNLRIDNANYSKIDQRVINFVLETRAHIEEIIYIKKYKDNETYISSQFSFLLYLNNPIIQSIKVQNVSFSDALYVTHQLNQIKQRIPEMLKYDVVKDLFNRFNMRY